MKDFNILTEGRYEPASDIEYAVLRDSIYDGKRHLVYTGVLKTNDKYIKQQTGVILHTIEDYIDASANVEEYIKQNRWRNIIASEIANQVNNPQFARYNFSFLNSVHNSAIKTRA
jgi:hypothetical protein